MGEINKTTVAVVQGSGVRRESERERCKPRRSVLAWVQLLRRTHRLEFYVGVRKGYVLRGARRRKISTQSGTETRRSFATVKRFSLSLEPKRSTSWTSGQATILSICTAREAR